jgi:prepilin-type N-terminal cleavage/methylation domain-containing protein
MRRARGFTLIELLVALALAGIVVAGAFQMHLAFNRQSQRQQQVTEMQQTLRVAMQLVERAIRQAGQGLGPTKSISGFASNCTSTTYYGFQWSDGNAYTDPDTTYGTAGVVDTDPDWFRVVYSDTMSEDGVTYTQGNGVNISFVSQSPQSWNVGDLFVVVPDLSKVVGGASPSCSYNCLTQVYEVTSAYTGTPTMAAPGMIKNQNGGSCYNPPPGLDKCLSGNGRPNGCAGPGATLRHVSNGGIVYKIMTPAEQGDTAAVGNTTVTPKLAMRQAVFGTSATAQQWIPIADNIEDMQIAVILADGTICGNGGSVVDDPRPGAANRCQLDIDPTKLDANGNVIANGPAAVRVTLVARSSQPLHGVPASPLGGYENRPSSTPPTTTRDAYYLRRAMTATIQLRNYTQ